jgi:Holin of 3TMs, for gene-transfer release
MSASDPITAALNIGSALIEKLFPDPAQQADARLKLLALQQSGELAQIQASTQIIVAEASSESWAARNWRPILMLTFGFLIVARWFGWAAPNLSEAEYLKLWDIVQLGLGGYVVGRSVEKSIPSITAAINAAKS